MKKEQKYKYHCEAVSERCREIEMLVNEMMSNFNIYNTSCTADEKIGYMEQVYERLCVIRDGLYGNLYGKIRR